MSSPIQKGDKVRASADGPLMDVLGASEKLAICSWVDDGGLQREEIFPTTNLRRVIQQLQQQPQADDGAEA